jgi:hypothetical protein
VTSQGKDLESARARLSEAIELYLETWALRKNDFRTVVPEHCELAKGTSSDILKQCGLKLEEFLSLL